MFIAYRSARHKLQAASQTRAGRERLLISAEGSQSSKKAALELVELLGSKTVDVVVDREKMTGYTSAARMTGQRCFYPVSEICGRSWPRSSARRIRFFSSMLDLNEKRGVA